MNFSKLELQYINNLQYMNYHLIWQHTSRLQPLGSLQQLQLVSLIEYQEDLNQAPPDSDNDFKPGIEQAGQHHAGTIVIQTNAALLYWINLYLGTSIRLAI